MEILDYSKKAMIIERIKQIRENVADWLIVEVRLKDAARHRFTSEGIAALIRAVCVDHDGIIIACNEAEVLMLIEWGRQNKPERLAMKVRNELPAETCDAAVSHVTSDGLKKMTLFISPPAAKDNAFYGIRLTRKQNIILIADDDQYLRALLKAGLKGTGTVVEIDNGDNVLEAYKSYNPDIVLLDIHLPGLKGPEILSRAKAFDPTAYIIMISADSSPENVTWTRQHGAKGFLAKPFNKTKLLNYVETCPTYQDSYRC